MRYLPLSNNDREEMLSTFWVNNIDELFSNIAEKVSINPKFDLPNHKTEMEVETHLSLLSDKNLHADNSNFFIGGGSYYSEIRIFDFIYPVSTRNITGNIAISIWIPNSGISLNWHGYF